MLKWSQYEVVECLGVMPEVEEYETSHTFRVVKHGLRLELSIFQYAGDVYISLYRDGSEAAAFNMRLLGCEGVRYVAQRNGAEYLEFAPARSFGGRYDGESPMPYGVRVAVNPQISIELF